MQITRERDLVQRRGLLALLICHTIFCTLLIRRVLVAGWESWTIPVIALGIAAQWVYYARNQDSLKKAIRIIVFHTQLLLFYYGTHDIVFGHEFPLVMGFFIMSITLADDDLLITTGFAVYVGVYLWHLLVTNGIADMLEHNKSVFVVQAALVFIIPAFARYIVRHRREENELTQRAIIQLEEAARERDDFMSTLSHELRTPAGVITGMTALLPTDGLPPQVMRRIEAISDAGWQLSNQVNNILEYSEVLAGQLTSTNEPYTFQSLIADIASLTYSLTRHTRLHPVFDVDPVIPHGLIGDANHIMSVMRHILNNVVKFCPSGGMRISVRARQEAQGINLTIVVHDTGPGMTDEQILQTYQGRSLRSASHTGAYAGIGFGLPLCRGIVRAMGGMLHIKSRPDMGTRVSLCLPQKVTDQTQWVTLQNTQNLSFLFFRPAEADPNALLHSFREMMLRHTSNHFGIPVRWVKILNDLPKMVDWMRATHLFLHAQEYDQNRAAIDALPPDLKIVVILPRGQSRPGQGRVTYEQEPFTPYMIAKVLEPQTSQPIQTDTSISFSMPGVNALVVDDDPVNLEVACSILQEFGINAQPAAGAREGLNKCALQPWDIIFLDYMMPEMDGLEMFALLRTDTASPNAATPVVALTANVASDTRRKFLDAGFTDFLAKPINLQLLEQTLRMVLPHKVARADTRRQQPAPAAHPLPAAPQLVLRPQFAPVAPDPDEAILQQLRDHGADTAEGLRFCGGKASLYRKMMRLFAKEAVKTAKELEEAYAAADVSTYRIKVHAVKSNLRTLGFAALGEKAYALEMACTNGDWTFVTGGSHTQLMADLAALTEFLTSMDAQSEGSTA